MSAPYEQIMRKVSVARCLRHACCLQEGKVTIVVLVHCVQMCSSWLLCFTLACLSCDPARSATSCPWRSHHVHLWLLHARSISAQLQCTPKPMLQQGMDRVHGSHQRNITTQSSLCSPILAHSLSAAHSHSCKQQMRTHDPSVQLAGYDGWR